MNHPLPVPSGPRTATGDPVLLVTGAAGGIGAAVARRALANRIRRLVLLDRDPEELAQVAEVLSSLGADVTTHAVDVRDADGVEAAFAAARQQHHRIDQVAHAAGILTPAPLHQITQAHLLDHLTVNTGGVLNVLQSAERHLTRRPPGEPGADGGAVVVVSSNAARVPRAGLGAYAASKAAASALARVAGLELAAHGIRCNVVEPGSTRTSMQRDLWPDPVAGEEAALRGVADEFRLGIPLGRVAEPDDVADVVLFLLSPAARHLTLQQLFVDGGASL